MSLIVTVIAYGIAVAIPLFTVYLFVTQDVFGTGKPSTMLISMGWGAVGAYGLALVLNDATVALGLLNADRVAHISGPVIEEVLKAAILVVLVRRPQFRYLVDGALYGIAVGIGFALSENLFIYLPASGNAVLGTAISRVLSTSLMHATASGLVGISLGRLRRAAPGKGVQGAAIGLLLAITLHLIYNNIVGRLDGRVLLLVAIGLGTGGSLLVVWFIQQGLADEKRRFARTLGLQSDVSSGERQAVQHLGQTSMEQILAELEGFFGPHNVAQIRRLLVLQANLGILQNNLAGPSSPRLRDAWQQEIGTLHTEIAAIRDELNAPVRLFLRRVFPAGDRALQDTFGAEIARFDPTLVHTFDMFMRVSELAQTFTPTDLEALAVRLSKIEIFKHVSLADLENLSRAITSETYADGQVLFEQGDQGDAMVLIEAGLVDISRHDPSGEVKPLLTAGPGDVVGEFSLLDGRPRSARARANGPVRALVLPREAFMLFIQSRPRVILAVLQYLAAKARYTTEAIESSITWMARIQQAAIRAAPASGFGTSPFSMAVLDFDPGALSESTLRRVDQTFARVAESLGGQPDPADSPAPPDPGDGAEDDPGDSLLRRLQSRPRDGGGSWL